MKRANKLIALLLAMVMAFSMFTLPASAVDTKESAQSDTTVEQNESEDVVDTVEKIFDIIIMILRAVHEIVGSILASVGEDCPLCSEMHTNDAEQEPEEDNSEVSEVEEYYRNNAQLIDIIDAETSEDVFTETDIVEELEARGFNTYPITYDHTMNGERFDDTEITEESIEKHPMYQTFFAAENGEMWVIYVINGEIFASPLNFNLDSNLDIQLLVSETAELTSYDNESNNFYITIPNASEVFTLTVDKIDASALETLSIEELCRVTGADIAESNEEETENNENVDTNSNLSVSTFSEIERVGASATSTTTADPFIVVSLGDSYSSGEGIEPFYDQDLPLSEKVESHDWLAHRSTKGWPALLEIPVLQGKTGDYRVGYSNESDNCKWYFAAVSGAKTNHLKDNKQKKEYHKYYSDGITLHRYSGITYLPKQLDVFNSITEDVDYVTLTIGGNDVGFTDIITTCATNCAYLYVGSTAKIEDTFHKLWANFATTRNNIKKAYMNIANAAGAQASIIVAGYPKLLDKDGKGTVINKKEATLVNENVSKFNDKIAAIIAECKAEGLNIYFVDVEYEFDQDGGHQAYSSNSWINKIRFITEKQDINDTEIASAYSMHPNAAGARAYARCVNAKIAEIERSKSTGTLSGKICRASDRITPITEAEIAIIDNSTCQYYIPDENGNYSAVLPVGLYQVKVTADGYIDFNAYASIVKDQLVYMETFLLVAGEEGQVGTASGIVHNSLSGSGVADVTLTIKRDWNNTFAESEVIATTKTSSGGNYSIELALGNYTVIAEKDGFVSESFNIIVQNGTTSNQNGTITPIISGNDYLITLTWDENPRDLDSHMVGKLSDGTSFHVFYSHKSQMDGSVEVCNLDYDDTSSYGPEHITLKANTSSPYYYYIYRFAGSGTVASSGAKVTVHQGNTLIAEFNVPTDLGSADYWNVFAIKDGELIINNTITSSANTSYAG